jgi:O-antigen/teichoic acid export membrane protein
VSAEDTPVDVLRTPEAGGKAIRGGVLRSAGYGAGIAVGAVTAVVLTRALGVVDFGRYGTVAALLAIVSTITDAGLTAVGSRELAVLPPGPRREHLLRQLVGLRIVVSFFAVLAAVAFAAAVGYDRTMVLGTLLGGLGVVLVNTQATTMMPLSIGLRLGAVTAFELLKQVLTLAGVSVLAVAGASLLPYFAVQIVVGLIVLFLTPPLVGGVKAILPRLDRSSALPLLRSAVPVAIAIAMNVLYLRLLVIMVSLISDADETGLYVTAFRVFEMLIGLPTLVLSVALPLLAVAGAEDDERLRYGLQRTFEVAVVASAALALVTVACAPLVPVLFGHDYDGAVPMLQIQAWALIPLFAGQVLGIALVALHRQRALAIGNVAAVAVVLAVGLAVIPTYGGEGAAAAGVTAEACLCVLLFALLHHARADVTPGMAFLWRPLLALAAGIGPLVLGFGPLVAGVLAVTAFCLVAVAVRAVPHEVFEALLHRNPGGRFRR